MGCSRLFGQRDDIDRIERAFFNADATADAELFGNYRFILFIAYYDSFIPCSHPGTIEDALGTAFLRVAAFAMNDGYAHGDQESGVFRRMVQEMNQNANVTNPW